ncbi:hypothetical protein H8A95_31195 [Bradyrhizobium sp. Pear76]|uniref:TapB family protein n=1 Tax=Bradyrhizobium oropedii TaxID=1571201 RepID=UPI001E2BEEDF|nr:hypothetical protein [Bradyrhizobium oropedii]MCC8966675.1 hypothetical protein [Bradyrhizobium oropedii]
MRHTDRRQFPRGIDILRYAAIATIGLFASQATAQQAPTPPSSTAKPVVAMEQPLPGDNWTYEVRDEITGKISATREIVITEVTPTDISVRSKDLISSKLGAIVYDRSWNLLSSGDWKYTPNDGTGIQTPLAIGKTWSSRTNSVNTGGGFAWTRTGNAKVVGQETVTTKAGTFEAFKIEAKFSSRSVKDPTRTNEMTSETWYAPAIDHWVKRVEVLRVDKHLQTNNTIELVAYGRKQ